MKRIIFSCSPSVFALFFLLSVLGTSVEAQKPDKKADKKTIAPDAGGETPKKKPARLGQFKIEAPGIDIKIWADVMVHMVGHNPLGREGIERVRTGKLATVQQSKKGGPSFNKDDLGASWEFYVPKDYKPGTRYGVFVFISAADSGKVNKKWIPVLDKHRLIWVGANLSGNKHGTDLRQALAVEGAQRAAAMYTVDPDRVYLSGNSGGGRVASGLMLTYPQIFRGGFPIIGANPYRKLEIGGNKHIPASVKIPSKALFKMAQTQNRYVFLTGDKDFNQKQVKGVAEQYHADGFKFVTYLQVPGMGHGDPNAEWFEKGIMSLDAPLALRAKAAYQTATAAEKRKKLGLALQNYTIAAAHGTGQDFHADAQEKAQSLRAEYDRYISKLEGWIEEGKFATATKAMIIFKKRWDKTGIADAKRLSKLLREAKKEKK